MKEKIGIVLLMAILIIGLVISPLIFVYFEHSWQKDKSPLSEISELKSLLPENFEPVQFPKDFIWGTASSAYQMEGQNVNADWWYWEKEHDTDLIRKKEKPNDFYHTKKLYLRDFTLAQGIKLGAYRYSVEMSRIEPQKGVWDETEIAHYRDFFANLKKRGVEPWLCMNHFVLPQWWAKEGGWESPDAVFYFAQYAEKVVAEIGNPAGVHFYLTFNEPTVTLMDGYLKGIYPPGKKYEWFAARSAFRNMTRAHREAYKIIHKLADTNYHTTKAQVGVAFLTSSFIPASLDSLGDKYVSFVISFFFNKYFLETTEDYHDFIGINYYKEATLKVNLRSWILAEWWKNDISPEGLYRVVKDFSVYGKPIIVTENGVHTSDEAYRIKFIAAHILALNRAIKEGIDVWGYFYWSLTDTYEWNQGYSTNYGLVGIHRPTQDRVAKNSYFFFGDIIRKNGLAPEMVKHYTEAIEK